MSTHNYHGDDIQTIRCREDIRLRPGMFIGSTGAHGFQALTFGPLFNAADEARAGFADWVGFTLHADGSCRVEDNGRGIPVHLDTRTNLPVVVTTMAFCDPGQWPVENLEYRTFTALFGMGATITALSEWCEVETTCDGERYRIGFERGRQTEPLKHLGSANRPTGLRISFKPDPEIFGSHTFDLEVILWVICQFAFLHDRVRFTFTDERTGKTDTFHFEDGLSAFVKYLNTGNEVLHEPIRLNGKVGGVGVEVAVQYTQAGHELELGYCNGSVVRDGGTHIAGFRRGFREAVRAFAKAHDCWPADLTVKAEDVRFGVTAVIHIRHPKPEYPSATRGTLGNADVEPAVAKIVREGLTAFLSANPESGRALCRHVETRAAARMIQSTTRTPRPAG